VVSPSGRLRQAVAAVPGGGGHGRRGSGGMECGGGALGCGGACLGVGAASSELKWRGRRPDRGAWHGGDHGVAAAVA
jgi:hypothetical protein